MASSSQVSYDELIKQVQDLQKENTDLRRELLHSSSNIRQMESDTSALRDSLVSIRSTMNDTDTHAAAAAYDAATSDIYTSRQTPSTIMLPTDVPFHDHAYSFTGSKFFYLYVSRSCIIHQNSKFNDPFCLNFC